MRVLTICQPYAHAVMYGAIVRTREGLRVLFKRVENRKWGGSITYRGPLAIHAGISRAWLDSWDGPQPPGLAFGAILGVVDLIDIVDSSHQASLGDALARHPWLDGHVHAEPRATWWVFGHPPRPLARPVPWKGAQGIWGIPDQQWERLVQDAGGYINTEPVAREDGAGR